MSLAAQYARRARLAASPDFAEQTKLAALRAEHRKQLTDAETKFAEEIIALRRELAAARRELNALRTHNEWYARKLKTYDGIAQLIAAAARTEPVQ
jgi:hypothetical protein